MPYGELDFGFVPTETKKKKRVAWNKGLKTKEERPELYEKIKVRIVKYNKTRKHDLKEYESRRNNFIAVNEETGKVFFCKGMIEATKLAPENSISRVLRGQRKTAGGFFWYKNSEKWIEKQMEIKRKKEMPVYTTTEIKSKLRNFMTVKETASFLSSGKLPFRISGKYKNIKEYYKEDADRWIEENSWRYKLSYKLKKKNYGTVR